MIGEIWGTPFITEKVEKIYNINREANQLVYQKTGVRMDTVHSIKVVKGCEVIEEYQDGRIIYLFGGSVSVVAFGGCY